METQLCAFWIGDDLFGIGVSSVQEIVRDQIETPIPLARPQIRGLINLRGQVVTVVDLRRCLGLHPAEDEKRCVHIVLHHKHDSFSLFVDGMMGVVDVKEEQWEKPAEQEDHVARTLIEGVYKLEKNLLLLLDLNQIIKIVG